jgi:hypothetical protein
LCVGKDRWICGYSGDKRGSLRDKSVEGNEDLGKEEELYHMYAYKGITGV